MGRERQKVDGGEVVGKWIWRRVESGLGGGARTGSVAAAVGAAWIWAFPAAGADMEMAGGLTWVFSAENGGATLDGLGLALPSEVGGLPLTRIGEGAFAHCDWLKAVSIPDGVETIGAGAFAGCSGMDELTLPDSVESLGAGARRRGGDGNFGGQGREEAERRPQAARMSAPPE